MKILFICHREVKVQHRRWTVQWWRRIAVRYDHRTLYCSSIFIAVLYVEISQEYSAMKIPTFGFINFSNSSFLTIISFHYNEK